MTEIHVTIRVRLPGGSWRTIWAGEPVSQVCVDGMATEASHVELGVNAGVPEVVINPGWPDAEGGDKFHISRRL